MSADETALDNALRRAAGAIVSSSQKETAILHRFEPVWGIVQSWVGGSPPQELTLAVKGDTTNTVGGIRYLDSYTPTAGDVVFCNWVDNYIIILGKLYKNPVTTITALPSTLAGDEGHSGTISFPTTPSAIGDILVVWAQQGAGVASPMGISGGGVTTWHQAVHVVDSTNYELSIWWGVITSISGTPTVSIGYSGGVANSISLEFNSSLPYTWSEDVSGYALYNSAYVSSGNFQPLSPTLTSELYLGAVQSNNDGSGGPMSGSGAGFVFHDAPFLFRGFTIYCYNVNVSNPSTPSPGWSTSDGAGPWGTCAAILQCT